MDGDKQYPPSDYKLERLRRAGIIPYSPLLTSAGMLVGTGIALSYVLSTLPTELVGEFRTSASLDPRLSSPSRSLERLGELVTERVLGALGIIVLTGFIVGVIQTRLFFSWRMVIPSLERVFRFAPGKAFPSLVVVLMRNIAPVVCFCILCFIAIHFTPMLTTLTNGPGFVRSGGRLSVIADASDPRNSPIVDAAESFHVVTLLIGRASAPMTVFLAGGVLAAIVLGSLSRVSAHVEYHRRHRMSRSELEAEMREIEMNPELRRGIRGQREGVNERPDTRTGGKP